MKALKKIFYVILILVVIDLAFIGVKKLNKNEAPQQSKEQKYNQEYIKQVNNIEIENSDIKNKYRFVFFSDLHLSQVDENEPDEQIRKSLYDRNKEFWVDKDSSKVTNTLKEIITFTNYKKANALLLGGDIIDSPADSSISTLRKNLKNLKCDYLYTLGNHDWSFPWDYQTENARKTNLPKFENLMDDTDVQYLEYEDLVILAINSSTNQIEPECLDKIREVLSKQKPTIVMMHVPISTPEIAQKSIELREGRVSAVGDGGIEPTESTKLAIDMILSDEYKVFYVLGAHIHVHMEADLNERVHEYITDAAYFGTVNVIDINN